MKNLKITLVALAIALGLAMPAVAQDKVEASIGADVVSRYVWRGIEQGAGASVQPSLGLAYKGLSLGAWGSTSIANLESKEFDLTLGYSIGDFGVTVTDYFWAGESAPYGYYEDSHYFEAGLTYSFGESLPLSLAVNTMFAGADKDGAGEQLYSTYINAGYDFTVGDATLTAAIGINPFESQYSADFEVMDITLTGAKDIKVTDSFSLPIFVQAIASPAFDRTYLVFGLSF